MNLHEKVLFICDDSHITYGLFVEAVYTFAMAHAATTTTNIIVDNCRRWKFTLYTRLLRRLTRHRLIDCFINVVMLIQSHVFISAAKSP